MDNIATPVRPRTFFILTYILSWLVWIPLVLSRFGIGPFHIQEGISSVVRLLGVLIPATAAMLLTARAGGGSALRELLGRLAIWRVGWRWWVAAAVIQPALLVFSGLLYNQIWGNPPVASLPLISIGALAVNIFFLALATLGEEIGWRGLALPALEKGNSALVSSIILGLVWATWHLPFWLLLDTFDQFGVRYLILNFLLILPSTIYITWFFNHGQYSLLLAAAFHVAFNIVNVAWLPVTLNIGAFGILIAIEWIIAILLVPRLEVSREPANLTVSV